MQQKGAITRNLHDLYASMGLPVDPVHPGSGFTVHYLQDTFTELPFRSEAFRPDYFSFLFIKNGQGQYTIDDHTFPIKPGMVYFTNPGNYRTFTWEQLEDVCLITFRESYLVEQVHPDIYKEFSFLLTEVVAPCNLRPEQFAEMEYIYRQICREQLGHSLYKDRIIGNLFVVLLLKIKEYVWQDYNPIYEGNRSSQIVRNFKSALERHYRSLVAGKEERVFRVQDYAALQHLHPNYLSTVIKAKTGKAIGTWIAEKTIAEARALLQHDTTSVKEIAYLLGFSETAHFSNYFKKHTGDTPLAYRKMHLRDQS
ncbi:AraC family transcriptional regulator [Taibaiella chishuiensis]|uniref:AraC-like DNA-binding protein n=1 Tax=Taibaiella chishuiensis TaxID=1434707 RepID=A0A2P8DA58_9BACT|nr:AraC family transcriptional regulator [Taibaiella chishuiensis]PSK94092.1 AraC-like DNA-binding protein [Taibaiella chishuiensis]